MNSWSKRYLTPLGKITIIKTLLISQFNHLFISLPNPSTEFISNLNSLLYKFLWNDKPDKIRRDIVIKGYGDGGLKRIDINSFIISLKLSWIRRLIQSKSKCNKIIEKEINKQYLFNCGSDYINKCIPKLKKKFGKMFLDHTSLYR